jgi:hypothetical protein
VIQADFDEGTLANMEIALDRACANLPADMQGHEARKFVALRIVAYAKRGDVTLTELTAAGRRAVVELLSHASSDHRVG